MNEIIEKLDEIEIAIEKSQLFQKLEKAKIACLNDKDLLNQKKQLDSIENIYSKIYQDLKIKYLSNSKVKEYIELENQVYILTLEINKRLKTLIDGDHFESN